MEKENGAIKVFNPDKDVAREVTLNILIRHRDATHQAREGVIPGQPEPLTDQRIINKVRGLYKMISAQREMINISRPIVKHNCFIKWKKSNPEEKDQKEKPFENEDNDYKKLMIIKDILGQAEQDMITAEQTSSTKDDYIKEIMIEGKRRLALTQKYFDTMDGLEGTYEKIDIIMLTHKIISAGIEEDEIQTYKEQEKLAIERVVNA